MHLCSEFDICLVGRCICFKSLCVLENVCSKCDQCLSLSCSLTMGQLYEKERDGDGFLYMAYSGENTFGF